MRHNNLAQFHARNDHPRSTDHADPGTAALCGRGACSVLPSRIDREGRSTDRTLDHVGCHTDSSCFRRCRAGTLLESMEWAFKALATQHRPGPGQAAPSLCGAHRNYCSPGARGLSRPRSRETSSPLGRKGSPGREQGTARNLLPHTTTGRAKALPVVSTSILLPLYSYLTHDLTVMA